MSKRVSPAAVGTFVVGAVTLAVIAVIAFGSGRLFRTTYEYILYFPGNVNGLKIGAAVKFKGIEIGSVKNILLNAGKVTALQAKPEDVRIPVIIELEAQHMAAKGAQLRPDPATVKQLVARGLRGRLATESFVTGVLYVSLDFDPESPMQLVGDPSVPYVEIPARPTPLEEAQAKAAQFLAKLGEADIAGMVASLHRAVDGLDQTLNSPHLKASLESLPSAIDGIKSLSGEAQATLVSLRKLSADLNAKVGPLGGSLQETSASARETLRAATLSLQEMQTLLKPDAPLVYSLNRSLNDLAAAARAIRQVAEELERDPSVLLRGKGAAEERQ